METLFFLVLSVCVVVLVVAGIQLEGFCKKHPVIVDFYTEAQKDAFQRKFVWYIAGGVGAILFAMTMVLVIEGSFGDQPPWDSLTIGGFLLIVAGAVWSFIYGGLQHDKYDVAKYNRKNDPSPEARRRNDLVGTVCAVIMLAVTAIYVGLGLALDLWKTAGWLFAVGGILCGAAAVILSPRDGQ